MPTEKELLERIRYLEEQNNDLQDKLDAIYSILAPDYEGEYVNNGDDEDSDDDGPAGLVNIKGAK